ncbi:MAG: hypothetical protein AAGK37_02500 [Pseudomonadota bacterium]
MTATLILLLPLVYVALQWAALSRMRRGWQVAALFPAICMAAALAAMAVGIAAGSDLAAAGLMLGLPLATAYLMILWPLHFVLSAE